MDYKFSIYFRSAGIKFYILSVSATQFCVSVCCKTFITE